MECNQRRISDLGLSRRLKHIVNSSNATALSTRVLSSYSNARVDSDLFLLLFLAAARVSVPTCDASATAAAQRLYHKEGRALCAGGACLSWKRELHCTTLEV